MDGPETRSEAETSGAGARILIVEDDPDYALLETEALEEARGFSPEVVSSAAESRRRRWGDYDAIVLDHNLPDGTGIALLREIVAGSETPVIMLTGENVVKTAVEAVRAGAFSYLVKTCENLEVLPEILRQALADAARRREHRRMAEQVQRAEKLASLGTLAGGLCHEMNNPLTAVLGYAELYLNGLEPDARKCIETISAAGKRLRDVVRALAGFAGEENLPKEPLDFAAAVREWLEGHTEVFEAFGVRLVAQLPDTPVELVGSRPGLEHVLDHLVRNALQAMEKTARKDLTVRVSGQGGLVRLEVEDTGHGVPPGIRGRIFDPFFTTRDPGKGMGMGLAVSHRIVDAHGGRIWHEPVNEGGSRFVVELPSSGREGVQA